MLSSQAGNDLQARMVIDPAVPVDERTSFFSPTQPQHNRFWMRCTMTRMVNSFWCQALVPASTKQKLTQ
jgi:hypothetical protein